MRSRREAAIVRAHLVAENQMCFVAAFADASETIDGMTAILRRQAKNGRELAYWRSNRVGSGQQWEDSMQKALRFSFMASATVLLLGVAGAQAQQAPNMTFFVTSTPIGKGGDLGGLAGADAHCQQLATTVGAGGKTWRAYLSSPETPTAKGINARDRIGNGPWQNSKGAVIAQNPDDLHSANNKLSRDTALTERGAIVAGVGYTPVWHDALTGSDREGRAFPGNINMTCNNWSSSEFGKAMLGHIDRTGLADNDYARSWNSSHQSRGCSQADLIATGGMGLLYCFAQ